MQNSESCNVQVFCRFRPFNDQETNLPNHKFVEIQPSCQSVVVHPFRESHEKVQFNYDYVFPSSSTQQFVYDTAARPIVESVMHGFNGTVFAFGQTSSGKTYTMTGLNEDHTDLLGIIPRMITTVFYHIENSDDTIEYTVKVSYFELYLEKIKDLLDISKTNLKIREDKVRGIYLEGLTELYVSTGEEVHEFMKYGNVYRTVGAHRMNNESSRSHSIFSITITQNNLIDYSTKTGKLHLIDLAGSEKVEKTGAEGTRLEEAKKINKSLTTLGIVITALSENRKGHIPYRDSKLTRILQDSLGGNSKTSLIITCSPSSFNEVETISSLRFGARAKLIKNTPKVNIELTVGELKLLLAEAKDELRQADRKLQKYENNAKIENQSPQISQESVSLIYESDIDTKYSDVLKELEDTRSRLNAEISINFKLRQELSISNQSNTDLKSEYDLLLSHTRLIDDEFISLEHLLKQKEEIIENLTIFKDKYENEFLANSENYLKLQQVIVEKDLEVEILRRKIKTNFDVNDLSKSQQEKIILGKYAPSITQLNSEISVSSESTWRDDKKRLVKDLQSRIKQLINLEIELEDSRANYITLEKSLSENSRISIHKNDILQRNLEQLTLMYHQLVNKKAGLEVEKKIFEKKIQRLSDKTKFLEESNKDLNNQLVESKDQLKKLQENYQTPTSFLRGTMGTLTTLMPEARIKKPIRGGSQAKLLATFAVQARTYSSASNN